MAKADIELLFGVAGGGSVSGASGAQIKADLDAIVNAINAKPYDIKVALDAQSIATFKAQLQDLTTYAEGQARAIRDAYKGIAFPQTTKDPGNGGPPNPPKDSVLKKDTTAYYNAVTRLEKLQASIRENTRKWSEAEYGTSSKEYKDLVDQLTELERLKARLETGTLKTKDFNKDFSQISSVAAESANAIHKNEENIRVIEKLKEGVKGYDQALISVNSKLVEVRKNVAAWSAAADGTTSGDYTNLQKQAAALETLQTRLKNGELSAEEFAEAFSAIKREVSSSAEAIKKANKAFEAGADVKEYNSQLDKVNALLIKTKKNLADWTAAKDGKSSGSYRGLEQTVAVLEELRAELLSGGIALEDFYDRFDEATAATKRFNADIELAGENVKSTSNKISDLLKTLGVSITIADVFRKAIEIGREMIDVVTDVDTAMTELRKVTDETEAAYDRFLTNAEPRARALGVTLTDVVNSTADFARLGFSISEATDLSDAAIIYKNVGDGITDINEASESIISTMQAFKIEASDVMTIVDYFNKAGNEFAISSGGVGDALSRSAAALASGNNTLAEAVSMIAATNTTIQNTQIVGTAMKSISMFLRASKTEAEAAGESTEGMANSVSELRAELLALTGQKVDIQIDDKTFKSTFQIIKELSQVWGEISDVSQANILELIGGRLLPRRTVMCA